MAKFKSNASRKRFLALRNKRKYAVGGLTPATNMYGDNTIPYTSSTVYEESNPEYQAQLAEELTAVQEDTSYQDDANAELNRQNKIEGLVKKVGNTGINKLADMAPDDFVGPDMGQSPKELLRSGADAFQQTRLLNKIASGTANASQVGNASANTGQLLSNLSNYGDVATKTSSAVKAGTTAIKSGVGVGTVGALMAAGGDKLYDKVDDNDATTLTNKEAGASALRGAGAGIGAISTASAVGATVLPTMFAAGAANAWNPIGWATLAAAGIGAGVTAISRKRKANKAKDAMDVANMSRDADANSIERQQRFEGLKNKQYSGFDYGGDNKGPGFYKRGGVRNYQSDGLLDKYGLPIGQNLYGGNTTTSESTTPAGYTPPVLNETMPLLDPEYITDVNGTKVDTRNTTSISQDNTPAGYTHGKSGKLYAEDSIPNYEKPGYVPQGAPPNAAFMMPQGTAFNPELQETLLRNPMTNPSAPIAAGLAMFGPGAAGGAFSNPVSTMATRGTNSLTNAIFNSNNASTIARLGEGTKGLYSLYGAGMVPNAVRGLTGGINEEMSGTSTTEGRLGMVEDLINMNPTSSLLKRTALGGVTVGEGAKIIGDLQEGDYLSAATRTGLGLLPGDRRNLDFGKYTTKIANKYLKKDASDSILKSGSNLLFQGAQNLRTTLGEGRGIVDTPLSGERSETGRSSFLRAGGVKNLPGGKAIDIGNGATKYVGQTHEEGGIMADPQSEIENNEIEKDVTLADGSKNPYIFSEYLNTDGSKGYNDGKESIASVAEGLVASGAPQPAFDKLAIEQELKANRDGTKIMNTTMAKNGGFYQGKGIKKYQDEGLKPTLAGLQSQTNSNVTSMLQIPTVNSSIMPFRNTSLNRNQLNLSGNSGSQNYGLDYMRTLSGGGRLGGNLNYTPDNISAGLKGSFGNNNNNTWSAGVNKTLVDPTSTMPTSNNGMNFNLGANFKWRDGGLKYQTRGLVMSEERQEQYDNLIQFIPGTGYVGPDGTNYGFNEADVVDFVNSGGLDSYNANQGDNYMPSAEAMAQYGLENDQQMFRDALRNTRTPDAPTNEATADPNFRRGQQGDLVVPADTTPTSLNYMDQDFNALNALAKNQKQLEAQAVEVQIKVKQAEGIAREDAERAVASEAASSRSTQSSTLVNDYSPLSNRVPYERYDDGDATSVDLRQGDGMDFLNAQPGAETEEELQAKIAEIKTDQDSFVTEKEKEEYDKLSAKEKVKLKLEQLRGEPGNGSLLKAAQFIPAALAYMDKPDYMKQPNKVGGVPRVNLENVSLDDRQAVINSDNAAVQRMISNSGMGTAGFAARMAGWQKKEGLSAAVTAEQQRLNTQINNTEAQMNAEVEARNRMIQSQNRDAEMTVDRFNTESEAATNSQRVNAVANATSGLLTQFMDKQRIDADDRRTAAIAGQSGVIDREGPTNETNRHFAGTDITNQDQEWMDYYDGVVSATKKQFGGMKKIPRYGYSTK